MANNFETGESSGLNGSDHDCDIPPGFRFCPTGEDLVQYLEAKLANDSQYYSHIPEVDIYDYSPMQLADAHNFDEENEGYFFTRRSKKYPKGTRPARSTRDGYWKPSTGRKVTNGRREIIGFVRTLGYHEGSFLGQSTEWLMQEYSTGTDNKKFHDLVAVKIYKKRGASNGNTKAENVPQINSTMQLNNVVSSQSEPKLLTWSPIWPSPDPELFQGQYGQQFPDQTESLTWTSGPNQLAQSPSIGCSDMGQLPDQQLQLDQAQSFLQTPESTQNAAQSASINWFDNHSAQMGQSPGQQHQHCLDQNQSFLQTPEPTQEVAQSASMRWFENHSAQMGQSREQQCPFKGRYLQQFTAQAQYVSCTPEPIQAAAPATQSVPMNYFYNNDMSFINTDPNFDPLKYNFDAHGNQAIIPQLKTLALEESSVPQQSGGQFSTDKNYLNSDDLQFPMDWYNCCSTLGDQYFHELPPLKGHGEGDGECANFMSWECNK